MRRGFRGRDIEWLQTKLNIVVPTYMPRLAPDGIFGLKTDGRVREFQKLSHLQVDGIVGPKTLAKLKDAPTEFGPSLPPGFNPDPPKVVRSPGRKPPTNGDLILTLSESDRKKLFEEAAENLPQALKGDFIEFLGWGGKIAKIAQLAELTTLVSQSVGTVGGFAGGVILTIRAVLAWAQAWEINEKMYATQGWAYAITAWVHNDPRPKSSPEMLKRFKSWSSPKTIAAREDAWEQTSFKTWNTLSGLPGKFKADKQTVQATFEFWAYRNYKVGNRSYSVSGDRQRLCAELQRSRESDFRMGTQRQSWKEGFENVFYPR